MEQQILGDRKKRRYDEGLVDIVNKKAAEGLLVVQKEKIIAPDFSLINIFETGFGKKTVREIIEEYNQERKVVASMPDYYHAIKSLKQMIETNQNKDEALYFLERLRSDAKYMFRFGGLISSTTVGYKFSEGNVTIKHYNKMNYSKNHFSEVILAPNNNDFEKRIEGHANLDFFLGRASAYNFLSTVLLTKDSNRKICEVFKFFSSDSYNMNVRLSTNTMRPKNDYYECPVMIKLDHSDKRLEIRFSADYSDHGIAWGVKQ